MTKEIHLLTTDIPSEVLTLLQDNRIIFGAVASTVNERYKRLVNFSIPISIQPYSFLVSKPREVSRIYLFTAPFTHGVSIEIYSFVHVAMHVVNCLIMCFRRGFVLLQ